MRTHTAANGVQHAGARIEHVERIVTGNDIGAQWRGAQRERHAIGTGAHRRHQPALQCREARLGERRQRSDLAVRAERACFRRGRRVAPRRGTLVRGIDAHHELLAAHLQHILQLQAGREHLRDEIHEAHTVGTVQVVAVLVRRERACQQCIAAERSAQLHRAAGTRQILPAVAGKRRGGREEVAGRWQITCVEQVAAHIDAYAAADRAADACIAARRRHRGEDSRDTVAQRIRDVAIWLVAGRIDLQCTVAPEDAAQRITTADVEVLALVVATHADVGIDTAKHPATALHAKLRCTEAAGRCGEQSVEGTRATTRDDVHHAAHCGGTVQRRCGSLQHFNALDILQVEQRHIGDAAGATVQQDE